MAEQFQFTPGAGLDAYSRPFSYEPPNSGIRTVLPSELLNRKTPEQEQAEFDKEIARQSAELELQNRRLKQQADAQKLQYDTNIAKQGQDFLREIKNLRPGDPSYNDHRSALIERMPLAVQDKAVEASLKRLDETDKGLQTTKSAREEAERVRLDVRHEQDRDQARQMAAKLGTRALAQFEDELKKNPDAPAIGLIAKLTDLQNEQKSVSELRRNQVSEEEIKKFYVPEVDVNKQPTGRTVYNVDAADDYLKSFPSTSNLNTALARRGQLRKDMDLYRNADGSLNDMVPKDLLEDWELTEEQIARYRQKRGEPAKSDKAAAKGGPQKSATQMSVDEFFQ